MKTYTIDGFDYLEKRTGQHSKSTGQVYLPMDWIGKRVAIIKLEE